jgi:hypothetical protein
MKMIQDQILYCQNKTPDYENFIAECPYCRFQNIFNRVSDLHTINFIINMKVMCLNQKCKREFYINGDLASNKHQYLIFDCDRLIEQKRYMYCILNIAQSYEALFSKYIRIQLVDIPFKKKLLDGIDEVNSLLKLLGDLFKILAFENLRSIFIRLAIDQYEYKSLDEIQQSIADIKEAVLANSIKRTKNFFNKANLSHTILIKYQDNKIKNRIKKWNCPTDKEIKSLSNDVLSKLLLKVKKSKINQIRNNVVHKDAFRPSLEEVNKYMAESRDQISSLDIVLNIDKHAVPSMSP